MHEKQALADGVALGANLQLLSGATSDGEDSSTRSSTKQKVWGVGLP